MSGCYDERIRLLTVSQLMYCCPLAHWAVLGSVELPFVAALGWYVKTAPKLEVTKGVIVKRTERLNECMTVDVRECRLRWNCFGFSRLDFEHYRVLDAWGLGGLVRRGRACLVLRNWWLQHPFIAPPHLANRTCCSNMDTKDKMEQLTANHVWQPIEKFELEKDGRFEMGGHMLPSSIIFERSKVRKTVMSWNPLNNILILDDYG
jgi:hypothetical protein